ncbi:MAG: tRNA uridine-5-carboxymethylaminomethyl(34) synthesis GTPase MnmE [Lachnospiraceae bacterium]|nr:tRNA uridine-5-carboxymethylaminomethyl(34) synthesis GTPase MnmE [Lachnospiraceae bacterium]
MLKNETIAAIATGMTDSGIGVIRISGERAVETGDSLFRVPSGRHILKSVESHKMYYGYIVKGENKKIIDREEAARKEIDTKETDRGIIDNKENIKEKEDDQKGKYLEEKWKNNIIDEAMVVVMKAPRSFTGEDVVEIQCHGGVFVMQKILSEVLSAGARLAEPGEFTKRAFLNGKIDLTRAEAVMDVIQSHSESALSVSVDHLKGDLFQKIKSLRSNIIYDIAFIESALDDPEHASLEGYAEKLKAKLDLLTEEVEALISTFDNGRLIKEGIHTVIAGKPNVGKSSLMNLLVGEERAIVTEIAGTTRDILQESVRLGELTLHITDTAGIRETDDQVERIGVNRAKDFAKKADLILYVIDVSLPLDERDREIIDLLKEKRVMVLLNKSDLRAVLTEEDVKKFICKNIRNDKESKIEKNDSTETGNFIYFINTTSKNKDWMKLFESKIREIFFQGRIRTNHEIMITNLRHREALQEVLNSLRLVQKSIRDGMPEDFYSIDLMDAYSSLGRIIGEEVDDDLVEEIFSRFCTGK